MDTEQPAPPVDETGLTLPRVTVRYWAAARAAAGRTDDQIAGATVSDVLAQAKVAHANNPRFAAIVDVSSFLLGARPVTTLDLASVRVSDGDVLEVLPPFAGG
jgi:sulfur-carrier protein